MWRTVAGLAIAVLAGTFLGMLMGFSRIMRDGLYPLLVGFNAIPKATLVPVIALIFIGMHDFNTVLMAFMISFFPIAVSVGIGLSTLEPEYRDILRSLGASRFTIFMKIALPKTLPEFFGALKVAVTLAFIGTNLVEIVSPHGRGLGALFKSGETNGDYPLMFAVLIARAVPETRPAAEAGGGPPRRAGFVHGFLAPYRDGPFGVFVLLSVLILLVFMQHIAALPIDMTARGVSRAWLGGVLAINGVTIVVLQPLVAAHVQRWNRSRVIAFGATLVGLGFGLGAIARGPALFGLGVLVWTLGEICVLPIANAVVADVAPSDLRGRYQGAYGLSFGLAGFVAPLIGTAVLQRLGAAALWYGCLGLGLGVAGGHLLLAPHLTRLREHRLAERVAGVPG